MVRPGTDSEAPMFDRSAPFTYEGKIRIRWSSPSCGYFYELSFRRWQGGLFTPCLGDFSRDGYLPGDEFLDRNLTRLAREAAEISRELTEDELNGRWSLWNPPGHHDPEMWSRPGNGKETQIQDPGPSPQ